MEAKPLGQALRVDFSVNMTHKPSVQVHHGTDAEGFLC
jgi:hypothetical protein